MKTIEKLFTVLSELDELPRSQEYASAAKKALLLEQTLTERLTSADSAQTDNENSRLFNEYISKLSDISLMEAKEAFSQGFCLGAKLILEVFST